MIWLAGFIVILLYIYGRRTFSYWSRLNVKQESLWSFLGTVWRQLLHRTSDTEAYEQLYFKYPNERFIGSYFITTPLLVIRDPDLIKHVLISDFDTFYSRGVQPLDKIPEPFANQLVSCEGDLWKLLKQNLQPAFTPGKIRAMFPLILARAEKLQRVAAEAIDGEIDAKDLMARYSLDATGACSFGIDTDTLNNEHEVFLKLGKRIFMRTPRDTIVYILKYTMPRLFSHLRIIGSFVENTTKSLVDIIMKQRNYKHSGRNDFIDLILELKAKGKIVGSSLTKKNSDGSPCRVELEFSDELLAAQVFSMFAAGADTTMTATSYTLYELAHHPEHQTKCQEEIDEVLARHGGQITFESLKEMKYLDACLREGMRMFPSVGFLIRKTTRPYTIPASATTLERGVYVAVPVKALHMDPEHFPDPDRFRPGRFYLDAVVNKHVYLPYGAGPRMCLGAHLAHTQSLAALAAVLRRVRVAAAAGPGGVRPRRQPVDPAGVLSQKILGPLRLRVFLRQDILN